MSYMHSQSSPSSPPAAAPDCSSSSTSQNAGSDCDGHQGALIAADVHTDNGLQIDVNALGEHVADISIDLGGVDGLLSHAGLVDGLLPDLGGGDGLLCGLLG
jgi:hypothetical protein